MRKSGEKPLQGIFSGSVSQAPDETPEELEHMAIRSCFTCILQKRFVGPAITPERWRRFLWRRDRRSTGCIPLKTCRAPVCGTSPDTVTQNERLAACGERREAQPACQPPCTPSLRGLTDRIRVSGGPYGLKLRGQLGWTCITRASALHFDADASMAARWSALERLDGLPARTISCCKSRNCSALCASVIALLPYLSVGEAPVVQSSVPRRRVAPLRQGSVRARAPASVCKSGRGAGFCSGRLA